MEKKTFCESLREYAQSISYWKVRDNCHYIEKYRGTTHSICNLKLNVSNEILVVFRSDSNYDCHFIIRESAE